MSEDKIDYVTRILRSPAQVDSATWNALLPPPGQATPFMRHEYLAAMHASGSAVAATGWDAHFVTLWVDDALVAACPLYVKAHSYGEYVFDWAWANAYQEHGLRYYPKGVVAVPFTPVPGPRLLARDAHARSALLREVLAHGRQRKLSSLHLLFADEEAMVASAQADLMARHTVQFHWENSSPAYPHFDAFLAGLQQEKRKKVRQERRKVAEAGVVFRHARGRDITAADWDFFYRCYERTYLEHGNAPYLTREFFQAMADTMAGHWLLFVAEHAGQPIACSLIALDGTVAYGRYWGALQRVDCLHFEACYYQPLEWCISHSFTRFEGGAQGEHKMARALMPVKTSSAHWLAHPAFADAVDKFLAREGRGIENYLEHLEARSPFRQPQA